MTPLLSGRRGRVVGVLLATNHSYPLFTKEGNQFGEGGASM